jgi:hypothetical protein
MDTQALMSQIYVAHSGPLHRVESTPFGVTST